MAQPFIKQYGDIDTEFYTTEETVKQLVPYLDKTARYVEPFDRAKNSKIYAVLKDLGFDIVRLTKDYDPKDDYDGRIIITNPPFISRGGLYSKMSKQCREMFLIMPTFSFNCYTKHRAKDNCRRFSDLWEKQKLFDVNVFDSPTGTKKVNCIFTHWKHKE